MSAERSVPYNVDLTAGGTPRALRPRVTQALVGRSRQISYAASPETSSARSNGPARGSAGSVDITTVPPKTAAMIMAIVADELKVPLNELRFISIKEKGPAK